MALLASVLLPGAVARAAVTPPGTYTVEVQVQISGEAAKGGAGGYSVGATVEPTCWWEHAKGPYTDAVKMLDWYDEVTGGAQTQGTVGQYGPRRIWEEAAAAAEAGTELHWYRAMCREAKDLSRYDAGSTEEIPPVFGGGPTFVTYYYRTFPAGAPIPAPLVDAEQLALVARAQMEIPAPVTKRNPEVEVGAGPPATLVGLPTWFWLDPDFPLALGNGDGVAEVTARLGAAFATVTAVTKGVTISSKAGGNWCDVPRAQVRYGPDVSELSACTVQFTKASVGYRNGYPVAVTAAWVADWEGEDADGPANGDAADLTLTATVDVPVAEVQNVVTDP